MAFLAENVRESIAFVAHLFAVFLIHVKVLITFLGLHTLVRIKKYLPVRLTVLLPNSRIWAFFSHKEFYRKKSNSY